MTTANSTGSAKAITRLRRFAARNPGTRVAPALYARYYPCIVRPQSGPSSPNHTTMELEPSETLTRLRWPLYFIAFGLILLPLLDFVSSVLPLEPYNLRWRFGTVALFSGFLFTPILGMVLVCMVATFAEHRVMQRVVAVVNLIGTVLLIILMVLFALDVVQLRLEIGPQDKLAYDMSAIRATVKYLFTIVSLIWLGIAGFKVSRLRRSARREMAPLVTGGAS
ncbi:MAG: hypothetical protein ABI679_03565 [Gemmatimonadota bacterium]